MPDGVDFSFALLCNWSGQIKAAVICVATSGALTAKMMFMSEEEVVYSTGGSSKRRDEGDNTVPSLVFF